MPDESPKRRHLSAFMQENWAELSAFRTEGSRSIDRFSQKLPAHFYRQIHRDLSDFVSNYLGGGRLRVKLVVDSNIIFADALRVARGKASSTARLFDSEFVDVFAPPNIGEEVDRTIDEDLPKRLSKDVAKAHARELLRHVEILRPDSPGARALARHRLEGRDLDDVPFLALAIEVGAEAVVTRDKQAFEGQSGLARWEMPKVSSTVITYETGSLAVLVAGAAIKGIATAVEAVLVGVISAVVEICTRILNGILEAVGAIGRAVAANPWLALGGTLALLIGTAIAAHRSSEFRGFLGNAAQAIIDTVTRAARALLQWIVDIGRILHALFVWIWNETLPATALLVIGVGVLLEKIGGIAQEVTRGVPGVA